MARAGTVNVIGGTVTELTNADVSTNITFQHRRGTDTLVIGTTTSTPPTEANFEDGVLYRAGQGEQALLLEDLFPGTGYLRLWAFSVGGAKFVVYHA